MGDATGQRARGCGCTGCLFSVLSTGAGVVLFALGLAPATREALPFGAGLALLGLIGAVPTAFSLWKGWAHTGPATSEAATGPAPPRPPASVTCPSCGGVAPLRLAEPTHSTCSYCRVRFQLPPRIARLLAEGSAALSRQTAAERQVAATVSALAQHERAWKVRLAIVVAGLFLASLTVGMVGFAIRRTSDSWHGYFAFGTTASASTLVLGLVAVLLVPPAVRRVVGHWSAIRLPGDAGLGCRVCGGPLPVLVAPVLRCDYCAANNLASAGVMQKVAVSAKQAEQRVLAVAERKQRGDELAASALRAFPAVVALAWFAGGAASGSVVFTIAHEVEIWPDSDQRFALTRTGPSEVCLAAMEVDGEKVQLFLGSQRQQSLSRADLARYTAAPPIAAAALEGRQTTRGRIVSVYRPLNHLGMHRGRVEGGTEIYFPNPLGAGEEICLTDVAAGSGPTLER
ncbi:MAG: hypothetical protein KF718_01080 [Polyangiaceae bacterium]|nr:hypothetical protein [Polyangiaceae bacterium]